MKTLLPSRSAAWLALILLLGAAARVPGLFWGYRLFGTEAMSLIPDEPFYSFGQETTTPYPRGLRTDVRLLALALQGVGLTDLTHGADWELLAGRLVSLVYGLLTLVVLFRLARTFFKDEKIGLLAAFFLALADLHVTYSHIGVPDSAATFWFAAALASAYTALERGSRRAFLLSAVSTGAAAAMRFQLMSLIPLVWWVARSGRRVRDGLLLAITVSVSFLLFNGLAFDPPATLLRFWHLALRGEPNLERLSLPLVYLWVILVGVGLPVFLLAGYGVLRFARVKRGALRGWRDLVTDNQIPICLAALGAFLQLVSAMAWAHRHAVVLIPFVAMLAAYGFTQLPHRVLGRLPARVTAGGLLALVGLYLAVQVASVQAYFVDDPLEKAGRWLRARVPPGELLSTSAAPVPPEYPTTAEWKANYLVLSARGYRRYLFKNFLPSRLTGRFPGVEEVWGGNPKDARRIYELFTGQLPYRLVKKIRLRFYTPELLLTEALWYPPPHVDEALIYERRRERERAVELLTPSRKDYLVTLDTGKLWHLEPGQEVRLSLDGEPLPAELREGITHLLLPGRLVSTPHSRLRLASDRPLPHLPLDVVKRLRPLGNEFAVESLLDDDLMPEGFDRPEVGPDGAVWRWTRAAAEVLLPPSGSAGPWARLAVRLRGRPGGGGPPQPVVFFLDGRKVQETLVGEDARTVEFPIPAGALAAGLGSLQLVTPPWPSSRPSAVPGSGDARSLGVAVYWLRLARSEPVRRLEHVTDAGGVRAWRPLFGRGVPYRTEAVSFPSGGLTLRADLYAPLDGGAPAVLLAHGASPLGRKHALYRGLARRLAAKGYWVLAPDFRGYGESERPSRIASAKDLDFIQDLSAAVAFLQHRLGGKAITVVGHSFGADVTIALAARDSRPTGVVAISPARRVYQRFLDAPGGRELLRDRMAAEMGLTPAELPLELVEPVVAPITIDNYADHPFSRPLLLVDGELEEEADLRFLRGIYRRLRADKAYVTIPNADHYFGIQRQLEERDPVTLGVLADVIDGWIREGPRWSRSRD